jgi:nucleotide-binding universal stress UspA family protein
MITITNILVPTDFGEAADAALLYARELAVRFNARLHLLHVADNLQICTFAEAYPDMAVRLQTELERTAREQLDARLVDSDGTGPRTARAVITSPAPVMSIVDYAKTNQIDLIVMGTHGRGVLSHIMMGSVAERVVRLAPCPVLTVRHPEHEFVWPDTLTTVAHA